MLMKTNKLYVESWGNEQNVRAGSLDTNVKSEHLEPAISVIFNKEISALIDY